MRKNNNILELIENLEKKLVLTDPELINNLDKIYNPTFSGTTFIWNTFVFTIMVTFVTKTFSIREDRSMEGGTLKFDLYGLVSSGGAEFMVIPFIITFVSLLILAYSGKSAVKEGNVDANDVKEIKQYVREVLNIKYYDIKPIMLKNLRALKNILEQRDISEEERQMILEFLEEMNKLFSA